MLTIQTEKEGWVTVVMDVPARGLIGYVVGEFENDIHGQGTINHVISLTSIDTGRNGALASMANHQATHD